MQPFKVSIPGHRAVRVNAKSPFEAAIAVLTKKGLRYAETKFKVRAVQ